MKRVGLWIAVGVGGVVLACICLLVAVSFLPNPPAAATTPTTEAAATVSPSSTPDPTATPAPVSGGLGLSQFEWERNHTATDDDILGTIYDDAYIVSFVGGNVQYIERQWTRENAQTPEQIEAEADGLIPLDAAFAERYSPQGRPETIVLVYASAWLSGRFESDWWFGAEPGTFAVQYNVFDGRVTRMIIATGNNP